MLRNWTLFQTLPTEQLIKVKYVHIFEGGRSVLYVTNEDVVFGMGSNGNYNLLGLSANDRTFNSITEPVRIERLSSKGIRTIAVGEFFGVASNSSGELFHWGRRMDKRRGILLPHQVKCSHFVEDVACGNEFLVVLTKERRVFFRGAFQQNDSPTVEFAEVSPFLNATAISCGVFHAAVLSAEGFVFTCGYDHHQTYRTWKSSEGLKPKKLDLRETCVQIVCGRRTTLCLLKSGVVLACGENDNLGVESANSVMKIPTRVRIAEPVLELAASWYSNVYAALTPFGRVYSWGNQTRWPLIIPHALRLLDAFQNKETPSKLGLIPVGAEHVPIFKPTNTYRERFRLERSLSADSLNSLGYSASDNKPVTNENKGKTATSSKSKTKNMPTGISLLVSAGRFLASRPSDRQATYSNFRRRQISEDPQIRNPKNTEYLDVVPKTMERSKSEETIDQNVSPSTKRKPRVRSAIFGLNNPFLPLTSSSNTIESSSSFDYYPNKYPSAPQSPVEASAPPEPAHDLPGQHFKGLNPFMTSSQNDITGHRPARPVSNPFVFDPMATIEFKFPPVAAKCFSEATQVPSPPDSHKRPSVRDIFEDIKQEVCDLQRTVNELVELVSRL